MPSLDQFPDWAFCVFRDMAKGFYYNYGVFIKFMGFIKIVGLRYNCGIFIKLFPIAKVLQLRSKSKYAIAISQHLCYNPLEVKI